MNNKKLGSAFEQEVCRILAEREYWVHFITPDKRGAQPFDIIAVKDCEAYAIDCKTLADKGYISFFRLETNQILAFERWMACGNNEPIIFVKYAGEIYCVGYLELKKHERVALSAKYRLDSCFF